jgi:Uma2 family endonuclease
MEEAMQALGGKSYFTYKDYASWDDENRYELIDGALHMMSPAPSGAHQEIVGELHLQLGNFLRGKPCKVFVSPFDVRLNADEGDDTVVQPDIIVVCDKSKIIESGCKGVPDMVIEVLSPSTASHDSIVKFNKYMKAGVLEYWMVDPESKNTSVHILKDGSYIGRVYSDTDTIPVHTLTDCKIDMKEVFANIWAE